MLSTKFKLNEIVVIDCLMIGTVAGVVSGSWIVASVAVWIVVSSYLISRVKRSTRDSER